MRKIRHKFSIPIGNLKLVRKNGKLYAKLKV